MQENQQTDESQAAVMRILFRKFAPKIKDNFVKAMLHWKQPHPYNMYQTFRFNDGSDISQMKNIIAGIRCTDVPGEQVRFHDAFGDLSKMDIDEKGIVEEIVFPMLTGDIKKTSSDWNLTPYEVFMVIKLIRADETAEKSETLELQIHTRKGIVPKRSKIVDY